jgi:hypothetical protein
MQHSEWDFNDGIDEPEHGVAWPDSPEERMDRFGIMTALCRPCALALPDYTARDSSTGPKLLR